MLLISSSESQIFVKWMFDIIILKINGNLMGKKGVLLITPISFFFVQKPKGN